jgi:hypothetical protein
MRSLFAALFLLLAGTSVAQDELMWRDSLAAYWSRIEAEFRDTAHSPLLAADRAHFNGLERYAPDVRYRVQARFKARQGKPFAMRTTTQRTPEYVAVGVLHFTVLGVKERLTVYRNIELSKKPGYEQYLFVPFTDLTNGEETYGGGRYLDLQGPLGKVVELDLNRAYNPYCAYGGRYSCPIPPLENHLQLRVEAGVKAFADH